MTILLSYFGSTPSHDLSMPSTGFDYVSKFVVNIDTFLLCVDSVVKKVFVPHRAKEGSDKQRQSGKRRALDKIEQNVDVVRIDAAAVAHQGVSI